MLLLCCLSWCDNTILFECECAVGRVDFLVSSTLGNDMKSCHFVRPGLALVTFPTMERVGVAYSIVSYLIIHHAGV